MDVNGATVISGHLDVESQRDLAAVLRVVAEQAPFRQHETRFGKKMSVRMTAAGDFGWVSDRRGYRYAPVQADGRPWPPIPEELLVLWDEVAGCSRSPQCCLVNFYGEDTRMGPHEQSVEILPRRP